MEKYSKYVFYDDENKWYDTENGVFVGDREDDQLIAEFMQKGSIGFGLYDHDGCHYKMDELKFHESWDWLMPVIERIESLGYSYDRIDADVFINKQCGGKNIIPNPMDYKGDGMLNKTYLLVIEFINFYNHKS